MLHFLQTLDRRWIFLLMALAVLIPLLVEVRFPEIPTAIVRDAFDEIEKLPRGSTVLMAFDFDPGSEGELQPMANALTRHVAEKELVAIYLTTWETGLRSPQKAVELLRQEYPHLQYGKDYVNLGFRAGRDTLIKLMKENLRQAYDKDVNGTPLDDMPATRPVKSAKNVDLIVCIGAGTPGAKEWVQYVATPLNKPLVVGTTGVQTPMFYPYVPRPMRGMLGAIKGASEYEELLNTAYPKVAERPSAHDGRKRMAPQMFAHLLMVLLIVLGNVITWISRKAPAA